MNILAILRFWLLDQFLFHCGGGGGGDGGAAEREKQRQSRIEAATEAVNSIFGKGPTDADIAGLQTDMQAQLNAAQNPADYGGFANNKTVNRMVAQGQANELASDITRARGNAVTGNSAAQAREQIYKQVGDDTRDFYSKQLGEDAEAALRDMRFTQARNGTFGSSQAIDMQREFDRRNDRGLLDVANRADSAQTGLRTNDEKSRIDLISRIVNGADQATATSSALSQLSTNADAAKQNAMASRMANVFAGMADAWKGNQVALGEEAARRRMENEFGAFFGNNNGQSVQGTVTR